VDPQLAPLPVVSLSNYPNPFNPSTEIRFQLSDASQLEHTQIEIFNTKGQKVKELKADMSSRPQRRDLSCTVTWDGTDSANQPVSSGVYLYQLRAGKQTLAQKKMMLLK
jgi:flagellar hook assembly protein FlgD